MKTDTFELMELRSIPIPFFAQFRQWRRNRIRVQAIRDGLDQLARFPADVHGNAWFSVFVLAEPLDDPRWAKTMAASIERAKEYNTSWMLQVLAHWGLASYPGLPVATLRRQTLDITVPIWKAGDRRDEVAPVIGRAIRLEQTDFCPRQGADWEEVFALLPRIPTDKASLIPAESLLAGGLLCAAKGLDLDSALGLITSAVPARVGYVGRLMEKLGPEADKAEAGYASLLERESEVGEAMWNCPAQKAYLARRIEFYETVHRDLSSRHPILDFNLTT